MAGSYRHCINREGEFQGMKNLDNMRDAHEALEEMYDIIQALSGGDPIKIYNAWLDGHVRKRLPDRVRDEPGLFTFNEFWPGAQE